ncbi:histidine kinase dimerization/phospho-acceptor domain-containing protein [Chthonomonas calidirosea]|uniref:histidine kinase dimerization/phospho-acceptor domain-containing protein n=1 Tax=Chthonomonas calidirosea TaxID=454171 RepID=UPI0006EC4E6E|nr:histidine kinase dimerization/phospho-acceptor domain-containing protein [Chthonomonas calidirosea]CEK20669.1 signal transduction histidine kinase [Chthonomonas calidirosea]
MLFNSMRWRMTLVFSGATAILLLIACYVTIRYSRITMERSADILLQTAAKKVRHELAHLQPNETTLYELTEQERDLTEENIALQMLNSHGKLVWSSTAQMPVWPWGDRDDWRGTSFRFGSGTIVIGLPWLKHERSQERLEITLIVLSLFIFFTVTGGAWLLVGRTLSPIGRLAGQARSASVERMRVHLTAPSKDVEIVELVVTLNGLLDRLAESAAARGRFYAAVSHELRTPLQALYGHLELALQRPRSETEYRVYVEEALAQTRRLAALVRDLLLLNRIEMAPTPSSEALDLVEICERQLVHYASLAAKRHLQLHTEFPPFLEIIAPTNHAEMLVRNLVENALKYAKEGGQVRIALKSSTPGTDLEIFNECTPLAPSELERLTEPFYRPDSSRNTATGGNGLGLTICKAIADTCGWSLELCSVPTGFLCRVHFPC